MIVHMFLLGAMLGRPVSAQPVPPKQPFTLRVTTEANSVDVGSDLSVQIVLVNDSHTPLNCSDNLSDLTGQDWNFMIDVRDELGRKIPKREYPHPELEGGKPLLGCTVLPGSTWSINQSVDRIFDMTRPGKYVITVSRPVSFTDAKAGTVTSNPITVTVLPPPFSLKISTATNEFKTGSKILMTVRLTNDSGANLAFGASGPPVDHHYFYSCDSDTASKNLVFYSLHDRDDPPLIVIKPGQSHDDQVILNSACDLSQPGKYRVRVARDDPTNPNAGVIRSNEITLSVTP